MSVSRVFLDYHRGGCLSTKYMKLVNHCFEEPVSVVPEDKNYGVVRLCSCNRTSPLSLTLSHRGRGDLKAPLPLMGGVGGGCKAMISCTGKMLLLPDNTVIKNRKFKKYDRVDNFF